MFQVSSGNLLFSTKIPFEFSMICRETRQGRNTVILSLPVKTLAKSASSALMLLQQLSLKGGKSLFALSTVHRDVGFLPYWGK